MPVKDKKEETLLQSISKEQEVLLELKTWETKVTFINY